MAHECCPRHRVCGVGSVESGTAVQAGAYELFAPALVGGAVDVRTTSS